MFWGWSGFGQVLASLAKSWQPGQVLAGMARPLPSSHAKQAILVFAGQSLGSCVRLPPAVVPPEKQQPPNFGHASLARYWHLLVTF